MQVKPNNKADVRLQLECGDSIDSTIFDQILEMDDDGDQEFSRSIVFGFFEQAEQTLADMKKESYVKPTHCTGMEF